MILYFSATGNCKYVAERLAQSAEIVSIVDCIREKRSTFADDIIGIVSPTYDWGLPSIVREFLETATFFTPPPINVEEPKNSRIPYCMPHLLKLRQGLLNFQKTVAFFKKIWYNDFCLRGMA